MDAEGARKQGQLAPEAGQGRNAGQAEHERGQHPRQHALSRLLAPGQPGEAVHVIDRLLGSAQAMSAAKVPKVATA